MPANPHGYWLTAIIVLGSLCTNAFAQLPPVKASSGITYVSGGIGDDEEIHIRRAAKDFGLLLEFTEVERGKLHGHWSSDVNVTVIAGNKQLFAAQADGPLMTIGLKPGSYAIEAERAGVKLVKRVEVKAGAVTRERFIWVVDLPLQPR